MGATCLPTEILLLVLQNFDFESLLRLREINRTWRSAATYAAVNIIRQEISGYVVKYNPDPDPSIPGPAYSLVALMGSY